MRIFITGGAGFVGSHLTDYFLDRGEHVTALDLLPFNGDSYLWQHRDNPRFRYFQDSILNQGLIDHLVRESDMVYHLAAAVGLSNVIGNVLNVIEGNITGTKIVLESAFAHGKRVLFTSTSEIAGKSQAVPFRENDDRVLGSTTVDRWVYSETKAIGEYLCLGYHRQGLPVSTVRLFNAYGPRLDKGGGGRVVTRFIRQIMRDEPVTLIGNGEQTRSFTYIADIVNGIVAAGEREEAIGGIFNLGSSVETSINDLVKLIAEVVGKEPSIRSVALEELYGPGYEDVPRRVPDLHRSEAFLGFEAAVPLREGIRMTYEWLADLESQRKSDPEAAAKMTRKAVP